MNYCRKDVSKSFSDISTDQEHEKKKTKKDFKNVKLKSSLCRNYSESGYCPYGEKCQFAHGVEQLKCNMRQGSYKTKLCKSFLEKGYCFYGLRCNFVHLREETAKNQTQLKSYRELIYSGRNQCESKLDFGNSEKITLFNEEN